MQISIAFRHKILGNHQAYIKVSSLFTINSALNIYAMAACVIAVRISATYDFLLLVGKGIIFFGQNLVEVIYLAVFAVKMNGFNIFILIFTGIILC